jgi:hypothetical protein
MMRTLLCAVAALLIAVGGVFAAEGVVTKFDETTKEVTVKVGDKTYTAKIADIKVLSAGGKEIPADKFKGFKADTKVDVTLDGDKIKEIKMLPKKKPAAE